MEDKTFYWIALIFFLIATLVIGYYAFTRSKSLEDFYIGGRKIGVWALAFTYVATWNSAVTYIGFPGSAYKYGMPMVASGVLSAMFAGLFGWLLLARKLRRQSIALDALTIPEYIERRYQSHGARMLSTITILFFTGIYLVAQYAGVAYILQIYLDLPYGTSIALMAVVMAVYTALGGFLAVVWTDLLCGLVMTCLSVFLFFFALDKLGGWHEIFYTTATAVGPQFNEIPGLMGIVVFSYLAFYTLGSLGSPQLIVRFFSIKDKSVWRKAIVLTAVVLAVQTPFMAFLGISVRAAEIKALIPAGLIGANTDFALPAFMIHVAPFFAKILFLLGVVAASMSTANSLLLVASTAIGRDLLQQGFRLRINDDQVRKITAVAALVITLVTALLSMNKLPMVVLISAMQLSISGASIMPAIIFGVWWKKGTKAGALASMSVGLILPILLFTVLKPYNVFGHPFWPSLICSFITYYVVSLYTRPLPDEHVTKLFAGRHAVS
jgi:SSS family transporter